MTALERPRGPRFPATRKYRLERGKPVLEPNLMRFAQWYETGNRRVARSRVQRLLVSTVFLGLDYNFFDEGPPILWETAVFHGRTMVQCVRTRSEREARRAHRAIKLIIRNVDRGYHDEQNQEGLRRDGPGRTPGDRA